MNVSVKLVIKHHPHSCHSCHSSWTSTWPLKRPFFGPRVPQNGGHGAAESHRQRWWSRRPGWIGTTVSKPWGDHWGHLGLSENRENP